MQTRTTEDIRSTATVASFVALALALACFFGRIAVLEQAELRAADLRFFYRGPLAPSPATAVVAIDEPSLAAHGRWPWPRPLVADLVDALAAAGPSVVVFDVAFLDATTPADDGALAAAIGRSKVPVVLGYLFHLDERQLPHGRPSAKEVEEQVAAIAPAAYPLVLAAADGGVGSPAALAAQPPLPALVRATGHAGFVTTVTDQDGVLRRMPLAIRCADRWFPALSVVALWLHLGRPDLALALGPDGVPASVELGDRSVLADGHGSLALNFLAPPGRAFPQVSAADVMARRLAPGALQGGAYAFAADTTAVAGLGLLLVALLRRLGALGGLLAALTLAACHLLLTSWLFDIHRVSLAVVAPLCTLALVYVVTTVVRYVLEERQRRTVEGAFGRYVSPVVIEQMLADPTRLRLGGEERHMTVLFSDLAGFTSTSERLGPAGMFPLLAEYFEAMTACIHDQDGMLKEYVGDELMALFGAPLEQPDHATRACRAALAMRRRLQQLQEEWEERGLPPLTARTGVNTGRMLVGNLGSSYRFAYGALGDEVNLGSRLEGLNKAYGTAVIVGEGTAEAVGEAFVMREIDAVRVVGKERAVRIFERLGEAGDELPAYVTTAAAAYAAGLACYRERRFAAAGAHFAAALEARPGDGPAATMARRCEAYEAAPPPEDWDFVYEASSK